MAVELEQRIAEAYTALPRKLQRAARYVLDNPDDVALLSMRRLADAAGVHPSTMMRLAHAFDCAGFADFKKPFQRRFGVEAKTPLMRAKDLQERHGANNRTRLIAEMLESETRNVMETFGRNAPEKLVACAKLLTDARRVFVVGARSAFSVAFYLEYAMRMLRDDVVLLGGRGGTFGDALRAMRPGDAVVAIGCEPYAYDTVRALAYAKDNGGTTVALTDNSASPLAEQAQRVLLVRNDSPAVFNSLSTVMALAETLVALMALEGGQEALQAFEDSERQMARFDSYWQRQDDTSKGGKGDMKKGTGT